jgi:hypothetical protein
MYMYVDFYIMETSFMDIDNSGVAQDLNFIINPYIVIVVGPDLGTSWALPSLGSACMPMFTAVAAPAGAMCGGWCVVVVGATSEEGRRNIERDDAVSLHLRQNQSRRGVSRAQHSNLAAFCMYTGTEASQACTCAGVVSVGNSGNRQPCCACTQSTQTLQAPRLSRRGVSRAQHGNRQPRCAYTQVRLYTGLNLRRHGVEIRPNVAHNGHYLTSVRGDLW